MNTRKDEVSAPEWIDLELYLTTMQVYLFLTRSFCVSEELGRFENGIPKAVFGYEPEEGDYIGVALRMMLQRKYFVPDERVCLKRLLNFVKSEIQGCAGEVDGIFARLNEVNMPFRVSFSDGTERLKLWESIAPVIYGSLLHSDLEKAKQLLQLDKSSWLFISAPFTMGREECLLRFRELLISHGVSPLAIHEAKMAPVLSWGDSATAARAVRKSPYWESIVGHDANDEETLKLFQECDEEDLKVLSVCTEFFYAISVESPDVEAMEKMIDPSTRASWGDFSEAIEAVRSIVSPGISSKVRYLDDKGLATVRIWPQVDAAFIVDRPQVTEQIEIVAKKSQSVWKIYGIRFPERKQFDR